MTDRNIPSKQRCDLDELERDAAQTPEARKISLPAHLVRTFANAANGEAMPTIEDWALAARLTAAELSKAGAEIERLEKRVADLQQFHDWAEPQVTTHGRDALEIERLRAALSRIDELMIRERQSNKSYVQEVRRTASEALSGEYSAHETTAPLELIPVVNDSGQFFGMASPTSRDGQDSMWKGPVYVQARQVKATAPLCTCGGDDYGAHMETCPVGRTP